MYHNYSIKVYGEHLLMQWQASPSRELFSFLNAVRQACMATFDIDVVLTYTELLLKNIALDKKEKIIALVDVTEQPVFVPNRTWKIPVCYNTVLGTDLEQFAIKKKLSINEVIRLHTAADYLVYFLGFLPGFPYLLGLDQRLFLERKKTPSRSMQSGSVAIGGTQTGIYPQESPGGWHCIGNCPLAIFDANYAQPALFESGDIITFESIDVKLYNELKGLNFKDGLKYLNL